MSRNRLASVLGALAFLASCTGGTDTADTQTDRFIEAGQILFQSIKNPRPELPNVTRARLNRVRVPSLEVTIPARDGFAYLIPAFNRTAPGVGQVRAWRTGDGAQIMFNNGVIIATRGIGDDLASSNRRGTVAFLRNGAASRNWTAQLDIQTSSDGVVTQSFACTGTVGAAQSIEIIELNFSVRAYSERCANDTVSFENTYYVDTRDGTVWQSRQWGGEKLGYIGTRLLKK